MNLIDQAEGQNDEFDDDIEETTLLHCSSCGATAVFHKPLQPDVFTLYSHLPEDWWNTPFKNGVKKVPPVKEKQKHLRKEIRL